MQTPTDSRKDARHTPGPWAAYRDQTRWRICAEDNVAFVSLSTRDHDEAAPDAHLIAAAPDLLAALEEGRRAIGDHNAPTDCYATGPLTGNVIRDLVECPACAFIAAYDAAIAKAKGGAQ